MLLEQLVRIRIQRQAIGQVLRRTYPVARGVRTPVVVSAPGMATVSRSLPSGCVGSSHVLGQKFVRGSSSSSSTGSAAVAVAPQLPFTGVPVTPALALGAGLVLAGGLLLRVSPRRGC